MKKSLRFLLCFCLVATMIILTSCNVYGQRKVATKEYMDARREAVSIRRPDGSDEYAVFAAIVDIDAGDHVETLTCYSDGTVHLYLSTGEVYRDLHQSNTALISATQNLLRGLGERLDSTLWQSQTDLSLPKTGRDLIYLCSDKGIHTLTLIPAYISNAPDASQEIYALYRELYETVKNEIANEGGSHDQADS